MMASLMRGDDTRRNRSVLLARWRDAAGVVHDSGAARAQEAAADAPATATPKNDLPAPLDVPLLGAEPDAATLLEQFEVELARSVAPTLADAIRRMLAPARADWSSLRNAESRSALVAVLEQVEDVLDAVLLTGAAPSAPAREREEA